MNGEAFIKLANTGSKDVRAFVEAAAACPKSGLHNPLKNVERYRMLGDVSARAAAALHDEQVLDYFTRLIQRVMPKSYTQARQEVTVSRAFLHNFSGDQVRFLARSFGVPGDHVGQQSNGHRWPFGPVAIISPFNFPFEIPVLQLMGALYMGNRVTLHVDAKIAVVVEQALRLLHHCGLPTGDVDFLNGEGRVMGEFLAAASPRMTQFTGSSRVAEHLAAQLHGRLKIEDAGFDWKILGPDVADVDYVAFVCDADAYAASGQKCSAQSILFAHENWMKAGIEERIRGLAAARRLADLTIGPVLTWTTAQLLAHAQAVAALPGARVMFGARPLTGHSIPERYGAIEPTAVYVPLKSMLASPAAYELVTREVFGPFQIVTDFTSEQLPLVLEACERMQSNLTAAVVSNDPVFVNHVLSHTVNGTTYVGRRGRTSGAPQNHWFGPSGDPRGAGIGTAEAIKLVWSSHREIIHDWGPVAATWRGIQT